MAPGLTRRDNVVIWNVASKWRCEKFAAAKLRRYEEFPNRTRELSVLTCCHRAPLCPL